MYATTLQNLKKKYIILSIHKTIISYSNTGGGFE